MVVPEHAQDRAIAGAIVVGVDDGEAAQAALRFGAVLARWCRDPLAPTHVYSRGHGGPENLLLGFSDPRLAARQTLDCALERVEPVTAELPEIHPTLLRGHVASALVAAARDASMLVVGRPARSGRAALPEWSVPVHVATRARCPVTVVPAGWTEQEDGQHEAQGRGQRCVHVAVAAAQYGGPVLEEAFRIARAAQLPVRVLHVPGAAHGDGVPGHPLEQAVARVAGSFPDVATSLDAVEGAAGSVLERVSQDAAVLVVGRHAQPHRHPRGRMGTVARHVLRTSSCPAVFVDPGDRGPGPEHAGAGADRGDVTR